MLFDYNFKWRSDSVRGGAELDSQALDIIEGLAARPNMPWSRFDVGLGPYTRL